MLDNDHVGIIKAFIKKAGLDARFKVDVIEVDTGDQTIFKSQFWFQVITDTETDSGIEWRSVPVFTTFDTMGLFRMLNDNHYDDLYKAIQERVRLQEPLVKAKSVLYIGQSLQLR